MNVHILFGKIWIANEHCLCPLGVLYYGMVEFPLSYPVTSDNMNYACVVLGITCIIGIILWFVHGRSRYDHNIDLKHF